MAKIFISYSNLDRNLVQQYVSILQQYDHEILWDDTVLVNGQDFQKTLFDAIKSADGTLVFLTENASKSPNVASEIGMARSYQDEYQKFLIPLVAGKVQVPYTIQHLVYINIDQMDAVEVARRVDAAIISHMERLKTASEKPTLEKTEPMTSQSFAALLNNYLSKLAPESKQGDWVFKGKTDIAYGNPAGPWDLPGFLFEKSDYTFVLRSVARKNQNYLVVESVNLQRQLANLDLDNKGKFRNNDGEISLHETFDMTVGSGRRPRDVVRAAFQQVGMNGDVIARFNEREFAWVNVLGDILIWAVFREKAKVILQKTESDEAHAQSSDEGEQQFWLLKIYGDNWGLLELREGMEGHFNSYFNNYEKRPDYHFFQAVKSGDQGFAFDYSSANAIVFKFEITHPLIVDKERQEIILFKITHILVENAVTLAELASHIDFSGELNSSSVRKLFPLTPIQYAAVNSLIREPSGSGPVIVSNPASLSKVFSDSAAEEIKDDLGFQCDVDALAAVVAYREVSPPLAIALFGNWGSGKSFFMNKLLDKIKKLAEDKTTDLFCRKILQINFNSWHYSDANLWASMITKIFEDLELYGKEKPEDVADLFKNLNTTKELLLETKTEKAAIDKKIDELKEQKQVFETSVEKQVSELSTLRLQDILAGLLQDTSIQGDFEYLKNEYSFLKLKEYDDIGAEIKELESFTTKMGEVLKLTTSFFKSRNLILFFGIVLTMVAGVYFVGQNSTFFKFYFADYKVLIVSVSTTVSFCLSFVRPALMYVDGALNRLRSIHKTVVKLKEKADEQFIAARQGFQKKLTEAQSSADEFQKKIELLEVKQKKLSDDILDITAGKKIVRFIESRVSDERYLNSLGIISWVRKDFEQLDFLLCQQKDAKKMEELGKTPVPIAFELERIVLYIDDLDRCDESTVVRVLEAINLLLAFPLFVVIVGVDPRWMHNALNIKYPHLNARRLGLAKGRSSMRGMTELGEPANSYDYLEKIFQIPFAIKSLDQTGKVELIRSQLIHPLPKTAENSISKTGTSASDNEQLLVQKGNEINSTSLSEGQVGVKEITVAEQSPSGHDQGEKNVGEQKYGVIPVLKNMDTLLISKGEELFMEQIAFLIGDSPRTIKRFINIYRIIRTHAGFQLEKDNETDYYFAAMLMLAVITGIPDIANNFYKALSAAGDRENFAGFLKEKLPALEDREGLLAQLQEQWSNKLISRVGVNKELVSLGMISLKKFKENLELVSRFSFRNVI